MSEHPEPEPLSLEEQMRQQLGHALPPQSMSADVVYTEPQPEPHIHGPFTFLMNANHNALRGCITCGATWVGYMAGGPDTLHWHPVAEIEETQEQD